MKSILPYLIAGSMICPVAANASNIFDDPQVNGYGLDYCYKWSAQCGKPAADAFCRSNGFPAGSFSHQWKKGDQQTRVIGTGQVCDAQYCDRITQVVCLVRINNPQVNGYGLDYCREWSANCGKPAADAFCQSQGYATAVDFKFVKGSQKTRVINGDQVCDAPKCDRITQVICR